VKVSGRSVVGGGWGWRVRVAGGGRRFEGGG
jgi:hypothetical protein